VHGDRLPVAELAVEGGRPGRRGVHDHEVARREEAREVAEADMDRVAFASGDHQADVVAARAADLRRLGGEALGWHDEPAQRVVIPWRIVT
jgi:hypothetical protein